MTGRGGPDILHLFMFAPCRDDKHADCVVVSEYDPEAQPNGWWACRCTCHAPEVL